MKKLAALISALVFCILLLLGVNIYLDKNIDSLYYDEFGTVTVGEKYKNITLENLAINRPDTLFMLGSSELKNSKNYSVNPANFFKNRRTGFQVYYNGEGGYQTLVHAVEVAAVDNNMKNQKVVFILSPQWFLRNGIEQNTFEANSSQLQCFKALSNTALSEDTRIALAKRMLSVISTKDTTTFTALKKYCQLIIKDDTISKIKLTLLTPYFAIQNSLLEIRDKAVAFYFLKQNDGSPSSYEPENAKIDWKAEMKNAEAMAVKTSSDNPYGMDDKVYDSSFKPKLNELKDSQKNLSYDNSPEYDDFKMLLDIFKEKGIDPLIVNIPCNGFWYDYIGFNRNDINVYNENIKKIVDSYGFELADFSGHEYDKFFLKDGTHIGWKGWIYINEKIDEYYKKDKK